mgnify:CR=1 FL=1
MVDGAPADRLPGHLFKAQGLRCHLDVVVFVLPPRPVFVFDRAGGTIWEKLDDIGFADKTQAIAVERQRADTTNIALCREARRIDLRVYYLPPGRVHVVGKSLLLMNQCTLTRTITPMLQSRNRNGIDTVSHW